MGTNSSIEWTDHTFNPWIGCTKVSDGCKHCYAEAMMDKRFGRVEWGPQGQRVRTSAANWRKPLAWNKQQWYECMSCGWRGSYGERPAVFRCPKCDSIAVNKTRQRVFCASLADVFEDKPDQPEMDEWRTDLFEMFQHTPHLDKLLLTKRPENVNPVIERITGFSDAEMWFYSASHVWIGTSTENQQTADERMSDLLQIPAAVRFLSVEPLLGPVDLDLYVWGIDWVIVGGESGPDARPMHPDWVRSLRDQCIVSGTPFFFKQWGEWDARGKRVGKDAAGRLLDGREWNEFPR